MSKRRRRPDAPRKERPNKHKGSFNAPRPVVGFTPDETINKAIFAKPEEQRS